MTASRLLDSAIFDEIAAAIGSEDARRLCARLGGTQLYVPASVGHNHPIAAAIGPKAAKLLCAHFVGNMLPLPKAHHRKARVIALAAAGGMTIREIALATDYTDRHVYNILAESREDDGQLELFDGLG